MGRVMKYFKKEFSKEMFFLNHDSASDFYLTCWQRNRSSLPLLLLRTIIFVGCVSILVSSMALTMLSMAARYWFIFLTHWGLVFNTAASGLALAVSVRVFFRGPIDASLELPWYMKAYWVMYNTAIPIAFFITLFYWSLLTEISEQFAIDPVLDVFIHGVNSVLMLCLVLVARHPTRLLHFYYSVGVSLIYMVFSIIFHFAGGISPFGNSWIYPMLDWDAPGQTVVLVIGCAIGLIIMHAVVVAITVCRDKITQRFRDTNSLDISYDERYN